ncbi:hypothetical protein L2E82_47037 [Cichorium intybus]|uniref:Uncharacterized protein n=1 Tax=Cichorium intybus TaxID=13427 RepID=A0ACB8YUP8_CICIN|nr:hypothetical protein L2E82_47037 [Cichorium intybus]
MQSPPLLQRCAPAPTHALDSPAHPLRAERNYFGFFNPSEIIVLPISMLYGFNNSHTISLQVDAQRRKNKRDAKLVSSLLITWDLEKQKEMLSS